MTIGAEKEWLNHWLQYQAPFATAALSGSVPATGTPSGLFLRDDGTWAAAVPSGGPSDSGKFLEYIYPTGPVWATPTPNTLTAADTVAYVQDYYSQGGFFEVDPDGTKVLKVCRYLIRITNSTGNFTLRFHDGTFFPNALSAADLGFDNSRDVTLRNITHGYEADFSPAGSIIVQTSPTNNCGFDIGDVDGDQWEEVDFTPGAYTLTTYCAMVQQALRDATLDNTFTVTASTPGFAEVTGNLRVTGNLSEVRGVYYLWPSANAEGVLRNDGGGALTWGWPAEIFDSTGVTGIDCQAAVMSFYGTDHTLIGEFLKDEISLYALGGFIQLEAPLIEMKSDATNVVATFEAAGITQYAPVTIHATGTKQPQGGIASISTPVTIGNTATETVALSVKIPAALVSTGAMFRIHAYGVVGTKLSSPGAATFNVRAGTNNSASDTAIGIWNVASPVANLTATGFELMSIQTLASATTIKAKGLLHTSMVAALGANHFFDADAAAHTIAPTADWYLGLYFKWATQDAANTITFDNVVIEVVKI